MKKLMAIAFMCMLTFSVFAQASTGAQTPQGTPANQPAVKSSMPQGKVQKEKIPGCGR